MNININTSSFVLVQGTCDLHTFPNRYLLVFLVSASPIIFINRSITILMVRTSFLEFKIIEASFEQRQDGKISMLSQIPDV